MPFPRHRLCFTQRGLDSGKRCHSLTLCTYVNSVFFVCCVSVTFGWQPIHFTFNIHFCTFPRQIDWWSVFGGFALWNLCAWTKHNFWWLLWDCHYLNYLHVVTNSQNTFPVFSKTINQVDIVASYWSSATRWTNRRTAAWTPQCTSRGWKKMFLDFLLVCEKSAINRFRFDAPSFLWMPHTPTSTKPCPFSTAHLAPPPTPYLSPSPAHTFHPRFIGVSAVTRSVKSPRVCSPLCSDHLWRMRVLCVRRVAPLSFLYHWWDTGARDGRGGADRPRGRRVLVTVQAAALSLVCASV